MPGVVADPDHLGRVLQERRCLESPVRVHPQAFEWVPQGSRILVIPDPPIEQVGSILVPESVKDLQRSGAGIVLACGPLVGINSPHPGGPSCAPEDLLYQAVVFGDWVGRALRLDYNDDDFESAVLVLTDRDIWAIKLDSAVLSNKETK
jgi:hypothetical protein